MVVTFYFTLIPLVLLVSGLSEGDSSSNQHRTGYACEGSSLTLSCDDPYHINLIRANFGRFSISTCNTQGNLEWSVNCASPGSFANIKQNCNHKNRCLLPASSAFFGDPCPGTYKYLEVHYECVPKISRPGSSDVRSMVDDIWSGSSSQSSEQSSKPKIISPPPIIKPNIAPRTSSPTVSPSPSDIYINNNDTIYVPHPYPRSTTPRPDLWSLTPSFDGPIDSNGQSAQYASESSAQHSLNNNHCLAGLSRDLFWNYTEVGQKATQACPNGSKGRAVWTCVRQEGVPQWIPPKPDFSDCQSLWMSNLTNRLNKGDAVVGIAAELESKTRSLVLYGGDVYRATELINQLVLKMEAVVEQFPDQRQRSQIIKELLISMQDSCSNLLRKNHQDSWLELRPNIRIEAATALIYTLERTSLLLADTKSTASDYIRAHDYIYLAIHTRDAKDLLDYPGKLILPLPPNSDDSETSLDHASYSQFNGNSVELSTEAIFDLGLNNGFTRLFVVMFKRLDSILEPEYYKPPSLEEGVFKILNSDIIGTTLSLVGSTVSRVPYNSLRTGSVWIKITFRHLLVQNVTNPKCVYWDPDKLDWSTKGSYLLLSNLTHTFCEYDHLGYFGLIMDHIDSPIETPTVPSGDLYYGNPETDGTIRILLILGSTLNSVILLIALVTLVLVRNLQTKESALIHKNVTINLLLDHLVLLLILGTYFSPSYFNLNSFNLMTSIPSSSGYPFNNTSTLRSLGLLVALYHYFLLVHFVWILFDLFELHFRLTRKQFVDQSLVLGPSGSVAVVNAASTVTTTSVLAGNINPVKLRRYLYITSYSVPLVVILLISWSTSSQALPMFANLCSLEARSHLASFVIASSIILTGLGLILLLVTYSRIGLQATATAAAASLAASPSVPVGSFVYPPGLMTSADKFATDLMLNRKLKISLFLRFSLNLLAAINCALGVVYLTYKVSTIGYLFALTNVSLGLFVFSYYCLTKENIRARYSLICSYAARYVVCLKGDSKTDYLNNHGNPHHHHHNHPNVIHNLPLNSGLNDGLSRGIVVGAYNKNPSIPNLTGNPAQLTEPIIGNSTSMGALSSMARDYATSKHYLASDAATTESGSDYGCRRLTAAAAAAAAAANNAPHLITHGPTPNHFYHLYNPKQPCNPYSCHHMIEHVYECIDDEPYVAKVILPAGSAVASATLGNYRLHSMAAATAAAHHGHHLHHLHFQQTLPNHYLGYHNLESLHNSGSQFDVTRSAVNPGSSVNFSADRAASLGISMGGGGTLQRCLVSTSLSAKKAEPPITTTMPVTTSSTGEHNLTPL